MKRWLTWTGPVLGFGLMVAMGVFVAMAERAEAKPPCNCPAVVPTPEGPCVLIFCNGSVCRYVCP